MIRKPEFRGLCCAEVMSAAHGIIREMEAIDNAKHDKPVHFLQLLCSISRMGHVCATMLNAVQSEHGAVHGDHNEAIELMRKARAFDDPVAVLLEAKPEEPPVGVKPSAVLADEEAQL